MVKQSDERAFDIYLFLLKESDDSGQKKLNFNYDSAAQYLGINKQMDRTAYRRQIIKVLTKLQDEYKIIKFKPEYAKDAVITLIDPEKSDEDEDNEYFELPIDYFKFGWNKTLSMRAKFCYLINLVNAAQSDNQPFWSKNVENIRAQFGNIGRDVIAKGMDELHRKNLIEVRYDDLDNNFQDRLPKTYKVLQPYDFEKLLNTLTEIEKKHGTPEYKKALVYAEIVFEEYNPEVIKDIILKTKQYGETKIKEAFEIVKKKNFDNPKRKYTYVVGILENL
ncbi:hypothetical protein HY745_12680 [Candidatus Desantisbacteria bacterium]|nr:hypothetical protein [Candidatus Desantisbacteria bacterium]